MTNPSNDDEKPLDPAAAALLARVRRLLVISSLFTLIAVAAIFAVIGYRLFHAGGSGEARDVSASLPKDARVISSAVAGDRIVVTIETGGATEIRTFDLETLRPAGRLRLQREP
jgi:hypothetical protein